MDASAYNMSFDKEQLSVLCANYDRRIDALAKENSKLKAENARLRELVDYMTPIALYEASERERDRMRELGIEVD